MGILDFFKKVEKLEKVKEELEQKQEEYKALENQVKKDISLNLTGGEEEIMDLPDGEKLDCKKTSWGIEIEGEKAANLDLYHAYIEEDEEDDYEYDENLTEGQNMFAEMFGSILHENHVSFGDKKELKSAKLNEQQKETLWTYLKEFFTNKEGDSIEEMHYDAKVKKAQRLPGDQNQKKLNS